MLKFDSKYCELDFCPDFKTTKSFEIPEKIMTEVMLVLRVYKKVSKVYKKLIKLYKTYLIFVAHHYKIHWFDVWSYLI